MNISKVRGTTFLVLALVTAGLLCSAISVFGAPPTVGAVGGSPMVSVSTGGVLHGYVTGNVSSTTQFGSSDFASKGWTNYSFVTGWQVQVIHATNITAGLIYDVTAFTASSGTFTTTAAAGNWTIGDEFNLVFGGIATGLEGPGSGINGSIATSPITTYSSGTTFTIAGFAGLSTTLYSVTAGGQPNWVIRVDQVDETADSSLIGQWRPLFSLSAAGVCVISPTMLGNDQGAVLDAGDVVSIVPMDYINPPSASKYIGIANSGGAGTVVFPGLIGRPVGSIPVGAVIKFVNDASAGAAPSHPIESYVTGFTSATGTVAYSPNFAVNPAVQDRFEITWSPLFDMQFGAGGVPANITAARLVSGVSLSEGQKWTETQVDSLYSWAPRTVTLPSASHSASGSVQIFSGYGRWRIDFLSGRVSVALGATGNQVVKLVESATGTTTNLASTTATGSDAWGTIYSVATDTLMALKKQTVHVPYYVYPTGATYHHDALASTDWQTGYIVTPDSLWTIRDSCQTTAGAGKIDWTIRATPLSAGATLIKGTGL